MNHVEIAGPAVALTLALIPGLIAWGGVRSRVKTLEETTHDHGGQLLLKADKADVESLRAEIRNQGDRMNARLDRLLERVGGRKTD